MPYFRPKTLEDALAVLQDGARVAAGCTDLFPATQQQVLGFGAMPVLDITAIGSLRGVEESADELRIGAATTWTDILNAKLPPAFDGLKLAAREVGSVQIQNTGTIGGNLCNASPAADGVPPLLTLDASVEVQSARGTRVLPLQNFIQGPRQIDLAADELATAILIPREAMDGRSVFLKLGARKHLVISIVMVAVRKVTNAGKTDDIAIAIGSCSAVAQRLTAIEQAMIGPDDDALSTPQFEAAVQSAISPITDIRADADYRRSAAVTLTRRALKRLTA
ncbi:MAG: FAD binding domain-containing protein [Alphaproteobacteria bacterium]